jgi:hypothetical protein
LGGPGVLIDKTCGIALDVSGKTRHYLTEEIGGSLNLVFSDRALLEQLSLGARERAFSMGWRAVVEQIYSRIEVLNLRM